MTGVLTAPRRAALPPAAISRPRLDALLEVERPLTVVTGPPGTGKTVLLTAFAAAHDAAWLSLAPRHGDAATLADAIAAALDDGMAQTLVLDDLHHVRGPALEVIRQLLVDQGEGLRVVVASRADPDLGLARLRLEGRLLEVRTADLAFTEDEAAAMLRQAGLDLRPSQVERLVTRTEGWAAGLRLAAMSAARAPDPERFLAEFAGDDRAVGDYLTEEVLALQSPEIRDFLLRTSVVDRACGDLANALTGGHDGGRTLQHLEHEGALIVCLDRRGRWLRCHGLFLELLRARLDEAHPDLRAPTCTPARALGSRRTAAAARRCPTSSRPSRRTPLWRCSATAGSSSPWRRRHRTRSCAPRTISAATSGCGSRRPAHAWRPARSPGRSRCWKGSATPRPTGWHSPSSSGPAPGGTSRALAVP